MEYRPLPKLGPQTYVRDEAYKLVPAIEPGAKGIQCGVCGDKFDHGKAYGYVCGNLSCPVQPKVT